MLRIKRKLLIRTAWISFSLFIVACGVERLHLEVNLEKLEHAHVQPEVATSVAASDTEEEAEPVDQVSDVQEVFEVIATGYYAGFESTGKMPDHPQYGITFSGVKARRGVVSTIAADLEMFPLGTILYIPGYGYGVVADIGSAVKGNVIDLYFQSKDDIYREWGKRTVNVVVIEQGDGRLDEARLLELESLFKERTPPASA